MKIGKWARLLLLAVPVLSGCANFWQLPDNGGGGNGGSTLSSGVFYVLNRTTGQIAAYSMVTGKLTAVSGSPYTLAAQPYAMAMAPNGAFLYVSTQTGIYVYTIGQGGALNASAGVQVSQDNLAYALAVDTTNHWLLDASAQGVVYAIPINSSTGVNTSSNAFQIQVPGRQAQQMVVSPDDKYIFVTEESYGTSVLPFASGSSTSPFTNAYSFAAKGSGGSAIAIAVDPTTTTVTTPRAFYVGETLVTSGSSNTGGVRVFSYSDLANGKVTELTSTPYPSAGNGPHAILPKATGDYIFVANGSVSGSSTGNIVGFSVTTATVGVSLTQITTTASAGKTPSSLAEDKLGNYIFVANSGGSPDLGGYNFDTKSAGVLDSVLSTATGTDPVGALQVVALP